RRRVVILVTPLLSFTLPGRPDDTSEACGPVRARAPRPIARGRAVPREICAYHPWPPGPFAAPRRMEAERPRTHGGVHELPCLFPAFALAVRPGRRRPRRPGRARRAGPDLLSAGLHSAGAGVHGLPAR